MAEEIERKFLVQSPEWKKHIEKELKIIQGYLSTDKSRSVRIRLKGEVALLTIKGKSVGASRQEFEYEIPYEDATSLLELCTASIIKKTRYYYTHEELTWEIDVFEGDNDGLILAEIELDHINQSFSLPEWVGKEVTEDKRYFNSSLALKPYKDW